MLSVVTVFHQNVTIFEYCFGIFAGLIYEKYKLSALQSRFNLGIGMAGFLLTLLAGTRSWNKVLFFVIPSVVRLKLRARIIEIIAAKMIG